MGGRLYEQCVDLLDANESTRAFGALDRVGCEENEQVKRLAMLARDDR
jgi:hypothetical protein